EVTMTLCCAGQQSAQHLWESPSIPHAEGEWSLQFTFGQQASVYCRLAVRGPQTAGVTPWQTWQLAELLRTFGPHWQAHPQDVPSSDPLLLPLERSGSPVLPKTKRPAA